MVHRDIGRKQLEKVVDLLGPIASVENPPRMEGRFLSMILVPNREAVDQARKAEELAAKELEPRSRAPEGDDMPKMKTHRGAAKRFKKTGTGKLVRSRSNKQHILTKKSAKRKRRLRKDALISAVDAKRVKQMLPSL
jgi:large subunit ribosomal protein L35